MKIAKFPALQQLNEANCYYHMRNNKIKVQGSKNIQEIAD